MRSIEEINKKIENGDANIFTAEEFKQLVKDDDAPSFDEVDVVTTGTCGVMSGTAAVFNLIAAEPGRFIRAKNIYLNGVPGNVGPCPNEWLGSVDLILHGTSKAPENPDYGGGFLLKDLIDGKDIDIKVETLNGEIIESTTNLDEMGRAQIFGTRMAFKNYTAFTNPSKEEVSSIFSAIPLEGNLSGLTFSGCGDLNPLQNDPVHNVIKEGRSILLNGAKGLVIGDGTRSSPEKPNLMLTADIKNMEPGYLGGFKTGQGAEVFDTVAIPIPVLNEEIYNNLLIKNEEIPLTVSDIKGRHMPLCETDYGAMWDNHQSRPKYDREKCKNCSDCIIEKICPTNAFANERLDLTRCFGCGICVHYCRNNSFEMDTGSVELEINGKTEEIPIICRQSDILRANKLSTKLKKMIIKEEFKV